MSDILERKSFACIAEGVAHYFGICFEFESDQDIEGRQGFHPDGREVWVRHSGKTPKQRFLNIVATVIHA